MKSIVKTSFVLLTAFTLTMCNTKQNDQKSTTQPTENFDWLLGNWKRTNEEKGKETFENWKKINNSEYNGIGFTLKNKDTLSKEEMKIVEKNGEWNLIVKTREEKEPTKFKMSELKSDKFVCVNDTIDFPKRIEYWKNGETTDLDILVKEFLKNKVFLEAIFWSSPTFYRVLLEFSEGKITDEKKKRKVLNTLKKYIIRSATRPTPYGTFAGVSLSSIGTTSQDAFSKRKLRLDISILRKIKFSIETHPKLSSYLNFQINNTLYEVKSKATIGLARFVRLTPAEIFKSVKTKAIKAIEHGFKYEVLLMTESGERLKLPKDWYTLTFKEFKSIMG
jgi:hypothetical protein